MPEDIKKTEEAVNDTEQIVITQEDLDENPVLVEVGIQVGDVGIVSDEQVDFSEKAEVTEPVATEEVPNVNTALDAAEEDPKIIGEEEAALLNKKIAAVVANYFRVMAKMSDDDIYRLAFTPEGQNSSLLLELINEAFAGMIAAGGDLPRVHFDSYQRVVESFNQTFVFNLSSKLEANRDTLVAIATGKTEKPERISHKDIIDAITK